MSELSADYEIRRFPAVTSDHEAFPQSIAWGQAVGFGFHESTRTADHVEKTHATYVADGRIFTGVYQTGAVAPSSLPAETPVATFGTFRKTLNVGFGHTLPSHLITAVTVRTTHRRRGLLRAMMAADLQLAKDDGVAMAALTASEASIYGRFGFGVASFERSIKVDTSQRFTVQHQPVGSVEIADPKVLLDLAPQVFDRVHQLTPGSIGRQDWYRQLASGTLGRDGKADPAIKVALHYGPDGTLDGYVSYKFAGWDTEPCTVEVVDLLAASNAAYLELWQFLGAIDLIQRVSWEDAPVDDPLGWALTDPRCIEASDVRDMLWLRILDVPAALSARHYSADGMLVFKVADTLGLAGGTFAVTVSGGAATVELLAGGSGAEVGIDVELDIADLSSIYLGAVSPVTLAAAGRIREHRSGAALQARDMFAVERSTHCLTHF